ncbi:MAG: PAS domain S-box protein, partial [Archaeoglobales archaeon]|nr:PAS domain S-box protein [Archaeoglobales archaeon]
MHEWDANFWKSIVDNMLTGVFVSDEKGNLLYVNDIFSLATRYSKKELLNMNVLDLTHPEDIERAKELHRKVSDGESALGEFIYVRKDGNVRQVFGLFSPVNYEGKLYFIGNYIDITLQKKLERKLKESEEFYRMLVDRSFAGIYIVQNGKI